MWRHTKKLLQMFKNITADAILKDGLWFSGLRTSDRTVIKRVTNMALGLDFTLKFEDECGFTSHHTPEYIVVTARS